MAETGTALQEMPALQEGAEPWTRTTSQHRGSTVRWGLSRPIGAHGLPRNCLCSGPVFCCLCKSSCRTHQVVLGCEHLGVCIPVWFYQLSRGCLGASVLQDSSPSHAEEVSSYINRLCWGAGSSPARWLRGDVLYKHSRTLQGRRWCQSGQVLCSFSSVFLHVKLFLSCRKSYCLSSCRAASFSCNFWMCCSMIPSTSSSFSPALPSTSVSSPYTTPLLRTANHTPGSSTMCQHNAQALVRETSGHSRNAGMALLGTLGCGIPAVTDRQTLDWTCGAEGPQGVP